MVKDIFSEIIEIEKDIQKRLEMETIESQEWLKKVKGEAEEEIEREEERLKEAFNRAMEDARADAERRASEIVGNAVSEAERLQKIGDDSLKRILSKHLFRILPGQL